MFDVLICFNLYVGRRQFPPPPMTSPIIPAWQKSALHEDLPHVSPLKPEGAASEMDSAANSSGGNTVSEFKLRKIVPFSFQPIITSYLSHVQLLRFECNVGAKGKLLMVK